MYKDLGKVYDVLIAGAGGAGLGLAYALLTASARPLSMAIVDPQAKNQNDRTWCFWGPPSAPFASIACNSWKYVRVRSEEFDRRFDLGDWRYWMVRGIDFYTFTRHALEQAPGVQFLQARVEGIEESGSFARVRLDEETVTAGWVFDSTLQAKDLAVDAVHYHPIKQHFKGWEIETDRDVFSPDTATLFDFRTQQKNDLRFCYVLPFSTRRALVEYTVFSADLLSGPEYEAGLKDYLADKLGITAYRIIAEENGVIPMTDQPFRRKVSAHVLNVGSKGGLVKPSTGYAFARMQRDALAVAASLERTGQPFSLPQAPRRYRTFDSILLQLLYRHGDLMKPIFVRLFERNPIRRILRFLDETAAPWEDAALIATLPPYPFLRALLKLAITRKV